MSASAVWGRCHSLVLDPAHYMAQACPGTRYRRNCYWHQELLLVIATGMWASCFWVSEDVGRGHESGILAAATLRCWQALWILSLLYMTVAWGTIMGTNPSRFVFIWVTSALSGESYHNPFNDIFVLWEEVALSSPLPRSERQAGYSWSSSTISDPNRS